VLPRGFLGGDPNEPPARRKLVEAGTLYAAVAWGLRYAGMMEWQTWTSQKRLLERACGFESRFRHV
jgi:hypothetical protein